MNHVLDGYGIGANLKGIVKGARHGVAPGIRKMNLSVKASHNASPWRQEYLRKLEEENQYFDYDE